ncbi:unnamed protein product [Caenorhabditis auriculariae]|uniref:Uncharacterized protein n=1 Tax=Caenorhabditis auriculariae TaxID=2777116 RepID=A0A8S1HB15_9PELO|nr:unnamed protein product [Caenorhabditis auriculariae]
MAFRLLLLFFSLLPTASAVCKSCTLPPFVPEPEEITGMYLYAPKTRTSTSADGCETSEISCELLSYNVQQPILYVTAFFIPFSPLVSINMMCQDGTATYSLEGTSYVFDSFMCADISLCPDCTLPSFRQENDGVVGMYQYPARIDVVSENGCSSLQLNCDKLDPTIYYQNPVLLARTNSTISTYTLELPLKLSCQSGSPAAVYSYENKSYVFNTATCASSRIADSCQGCPIPQFVANPEPSSDYYQYQPTYGTATNENGCVTTVTCDKLNPNGYQQDPRLLLRVPGALITWQWGSNTTLTCRDGNSTLESGDTAIDFKTLVCIVAKKTCQVCPRPSSAPNPEPHPAFLQYEPTYGTPTSENGCVIAVTCDKPDPTRYEQNPRLLLRVPGNLITWEWGSPTLTCQDGNSTLEGAPYPIQFDTLVCIVAPKCQVCPRPSSAPNPEPHPAFLQYEPTYGTPTSENGCVIAVTCDKLDPTRYEQNPRLLLRVPGNLITWEWGSPKLTCQDGNSTLEGAPYPIQFDTLVCIVAPKCFDCSLPPPFVLNPEVAEYFHQYPPTYSPSEDSRWCPAFTASCEKLDPVGYGQDPAFLITSADGVYSLQEWENAKLTCLDNISYVENGNTSIAIKNVVCTVGTLSDCSSCALPEFHIYQDLVTSTIYYYPPMIRASCERGCEKIEIFCEPQDPNAFQIDSTLLFVRNANLTGFPLALNASNSSIFNVNCAGGIPTLDHQGGTTFLEKVACAVAPLDDSGSTTCTTCDLPFSPPSTSEEKEYYYALTKNITESDCSTYHYCAALDETIYKQPSTLMVNILDNRKK